MKTFFFSYFFSLVLFFLLVHYAVLKLNVGSHHLVYKKESPCMELRFTGTPVVFGCCVHAQDRQRHLGRNSTVGPAVHSCQSSWYAGESQCFFFTMHLNIVCHIPECDMKCRIKGHICEKACKIFMYKQNKRSLPLNDAF